MERFVALRWLTCGLISAGTLALGQSFNCTLARSAVEKQVCGSPRLGRMDEALTAAYKARLARAPQTGRDAIRAGQRAWLRKLPVTCGGSGDVFESCLVDQYGKRTHLLETETADDPRFVTHTITLQAKDSPDFQAVGGTEERAGYGTLHVKWPEARSAEPRWQAWNRAVLRQTQDFLVQDDSKKTHRRTAAGWDESAAADVDGDAEASITNVSSRLVGVHIEVDIMGHGAAHPSEQWANYHWLLQEGRWLQASDVLRPGSGWVAFLVRRCKEGLKKQSDDPENGGTYDSAAVDRALREVVPRPDNWELDGSGLTVSFPEYTVAPRVSMPDPVSIPWKELKPFLAAGFEPPQ